MVNIETKIEEIPAKTILSGYKDGSQDWFGENYNMNLYKGCSHGCIYCFSRSECYQIEDFDRVRVKKDALLILEKELLKRKRSGIIGTGSMSDPYNPFEKDLQIFRNALLLIEKYGYGVSLITKSALVTRDIDLFKRIQARSPVAVKITITTPRDDLARKIEPYVSTPSERFSALRKISKAGVYCGILLMPCLPFIEDDAEAIITLINKASEAGVDFICADFGVSLRQNQRSFFYQKLEETFPETPELRGIYERLYGVQYQCPSPNYKKLWSVFVNECEKLNISYKLEDIRRGYIDDFPREYRQLSLLDI